MDLTSTHLIATSLVFAVAAVFAMLGLGGGMLYVPMFKWLELPLKTVEVEDRGAGRSAIRRRVRTVNLTGSFIIQTPRFCGVFHFLFVDIARHRAIQCIANCPGIVFCNARSEFDVMSVPMISVT